MGRVLISALALGLAAAASTCGPEVGDAPAPCTELQQGGLTCEARDRCAACFSIDATTGIGSCRGVLADITVDEMAAALAIAVSADDRWKIECPAKNDHLLVVAESTVQSAASLTSLDDVESLSDEMGLQTRVTSGCREDGTVWGGLDIVLAVDESAAGGSCCIGDDCPGAEYRCDWAAAEGTPTRCVATTDD